MKMLKEGGISFSEIVTPYYQFCEENGINCFRKGATEPSLYAEALQKISQNK